MNMLKIFKYVINREDLNEDKSIEIVTPSGKVLSVAERRGEIVVYIAVNPRSHQKYTWLFFVYGTGEDIPDDHGEFVGTVNLHNGRWMFHVFCKLKSKPNRFHEKGRNMDRVIRKGNIEIRLHEDGRLDEVNLYHPQTGQPLFHMEQMANDKFWMAAYGTEDACIVNMSANISEFMKEPEMIVTYELAKDPI